MRWLEDQVASIREAATKTLQKIAQVSSIVLVGDRHQQLHVFSSEVQLLLGSNAP